MLERFADHAALAGPVRVAGSRMLDDVGALFLRQARRMGASGGMRKHTSETTGLARESHRLT